MFRKPGFWTLFVIVSIICGYFAFTYFPKAFPIVNVKITMNRAEALQSAEELSQKYNVGPEEHRQAASYGVDGKFQNFVELEAGGKEAFNEVLKSGIYSPYTWKVRHFKEQEINEVLFTFTSESIPYGIKEKLSEDKVLPNLTSEKAKKLAKDRAETDWRIDFSHYKLVEESDKKQTGGRIDHAFVFEREDKQIGEGKYRLKLVVSGNKLTELTHFVKIPEGFDRRYDEMRSANQTISQVGIFAMVILYVGFGIIFGLFILMRQRRIIFKPALFWAIFIAVLFTLVQLNEFPLKWMFYDTSTSIQTYIFSNIFHLIGLLVIFTGMYLLTFMAAEGLTRKAFPNRIQTWKLWSPNVGSSIPVLGRTIAAYLLVPIIFALDVLFYFIVNKYFGWWSPSEALFDPNVLATVFPWFSSIFISLHAGFFEETLFRAIPLAGAILIAEKYGRKKFWIILALIVQVIIFGAGHASYPNQPAYARIVEMIIPFIGVGLLYIYFGLLPAIILHFAIDVIWFALPVFVSSASGIWFSQMMVILLFFTPLWIVLWRRIKDKNWSEVPKKYFNKAVLPKPPKIKKIDKTEVEEQIIPETNDVKKYRWIFIAGLIGLFLWINFSSFHTNEPDLTITRNEAKTLAKNVIEENFGELSDDWDVQSMVYDKVDKNHKFVWQISNDSVFTSLHNKFLLPPHWEIRFAKFKGDIIDRAEEYCVFISEDGKVMRYNHKIPESWEGKNLEKDQAKILADKKIAEFYNLDPAKLKEVSAKPKKLENRTDWDFVYADTVNYTLEKGEGRLSVTICGDEVSDFYGMVHIPEEWNRNYVENSKKMDIFNGIFRGIVVLMFIAGIVFSIISWSRNEFSKKIFIQFLLLVFGLVIFSQINGWNSVIAGIPTSQPFQNVILIVVIGLIISAIAMSFAFPVVIGFIQKLIQRSNSKFSYYGIINGVSLGLLILGIMALINNFAPSLSPHFGNYSSANNYLPFLGVSVDAILSFIKGATIALLIFAAINRLSNNWRNKKFVYLFSVTIILLGISFNLLIGNTTSTTILFSIIAGLILGAVYLMFYILFYRRNLNWIVITIATFSIMNLIKYIIISPIPQAILDGSIGIVLIALISYWWYKKLAEV
ncbi:MAG: type II CAAX endopeptidase family protein [Candidatus Marinimicrobia bacterium]|nr:type II CAAX endopeptidase family protein [Candidatus Neomarinimicrobiota bacterium]